LPKRLGG